MHVRITTNLSGELHQALKHGPCEVYTIDLRLGVNPNRLYTYPDITVVCGDTKLADDHKDTLLNPTALIEVLSHRQRRPAIGDSNSLITVIVWTSNRSRSMSWFGNLSRALKSIVAGQPVIGCFPRSAGSNRAVVSIAWVVKFPFPRSIIVFPSMPNCD